MQYVRCQVKPSKSKLDIIQQQDAWKVKEEQHMEKEKEHKEKEEGRRNKKKNTTRIQNSIRPSITFDEWEHIQLYIRQLPKDVKDETDEDLKLDIQSDIDALINRKKTLAKFN